MIEISDDKYVRIKLDPNHKDGYRGFWTRDHKYMHPDALPINSELSGHIKAWKQAYVAYLNYTGHIGLTGSTFFDTWGIALSGDIKNQLPDWEVEYIGIE